MPKYVALLTFFVELATSSLPPEEAFHLLGCADDGPNNLHLLQVKGRMVSHELELPHKPIMKGVSYGPSPFTSPHRNRHQDYFCDAAQPMWGDEGRGDLRVIRSIFVIVG